MYSKKVVYPMQDYGKTVNSAVGQFLDNAYYAAIGAVHPGQDFNGNGGGNTDFGWAVRAMADGKVLHVAEHSVWGWIILIEHPQLGVWSMYAHHSKVLVSVGQEVKWGQKIAEVGRGAHNAFLAHLHFEVRKFGPAKIRPDNWPTLLFPVKAQAEAYTLAHYYNPLSWLRANGATNEKQ